MPEENQIIPPSDSEDPVNTSEEYETISDANLSFSDLYFQQQAGLKELTLRVEGNLYMFQGGTFTGSAIGENPQVIADTIAENYYQHPSKNDSPSNESVDDIKEASEVFQSVDSLRTWFFGLNELQKQTFVISVAVFGGNSRRFIQSASSQLTKRLTQAEVDKESVSTSAITPLRLGTTQLLQETYTHIAETTFNTESGLQPVQTIRFLTKDGRAQILHMLGKTQHMVSFDEVDMYASLKDWLISFINANSNDLKAAGALVPSLTQTQAAFALGELAQADTWYFQDTVIRNWAKSRYFHHRFMVGWVLLGLMSGDITNPNYTHVKNLLRHWTTSSNTMMQWTAALSVSRIGIVALEDTLKIAKLLVKSNNTSLRDVIWTSLGLLYLSGAAYAEQIVISLASWINDEKELADIASEYYVDLIRGRFLDNEKDAADDSKNTDIATSSKGIRLNIWGLIGKKLTEGDKVLYNATLLLLKHALLHRNGRFVNTVCDSITLWIEEISRDGNKDAIFALTEILRSAIRDPLISRYINYSLNRPNLAGNSIVNNIKQY